VQSTYPCHGGNKAVSCESQLVLEPFDESARFPLHSNKQMQRKKGNREHINHLKAFHLQKTKQKRGAIFSNQKTGELMLRLNPFDHSTITIIEFPHSWSWNNVT